MPDLHLPTQPAFDLNRLYYLLLSKRVFVTTCVIVFLALGVALLIFSPRKFSATAVVQVELALPSLLNIQEVGAEDFRTLEVLKTVEQALASSNVLLRVIHSLKLDTDAVFAPKEDGPWSDAALVRKLFKKLDIRLRRGTRLIDVEARDVDPARARAIAEAVVKEFIRSGLDQKVEAWKAANAVLLHEAQASKDNLEKSEQALQDFKETNQAVSVEDTQNIVVEKLRDLNFKLTAAKSERLRLEGDIAALRGNQKAPRANLLAISSVAALPDVQELTKQINDLESQLAGVKDQYLPRSPKYTAAQAQLRQAIEARDRALDNAGEALRQSYASAQATEEKLAMALEEQEATALRLNKLSIPVNVLRREIETNRAIYDSVLVRLKQTDIAQGYDTSILRTVESPLLPDKPVWPNAPIVIAAALFCGLAVGVGTVLVSSLFDTTLSNAAQVEVALQMRTLASIVKAGRRSAREAVMLHDPGSLAAEGFRWLRTSLAPTTGGKGQCIAFAGTIPGDGATFCSVNFAVALAQQGWRVLLIDADIRQPGVHRYFPMKPTTALEQVLAGSLTLQAASLSAPSVPGLHLLVNSAPAMTPAERLGSGRLGEIIKEAAAQFECVVIDTAPLNVVSDTLAIAPSFAAFVLVIRARKTPMAAIQRACRLLAGAQITPAGTVLNCAPKGGSDDPSYFARSKGYAKNPGYVLR